MKTIKILSLLLISLTLSFSSCKKDPPQKPNKGCTYEGVVSRYFPGCIQTGNEPIVILDQYGNYFYVDVDKTGAFKNLKEGDPVCFGYTLSPGCDVPRNQLAGIRFVPIACIKLTYVKKRQYSEKCDCDSTNTCGRKKPITYSQFQSNFSAPYTILSGKVANDKLVLKIGFSGCHDDAMELQIAEAPTMGPYPSYFGVLAYKQTSCEMYIQKELCYDVSNYPKTTVFSIKDSKGMHTFKR
jgi:hypothetical protein